MLSQRDLNILAYIMYVTEHPILLSPLEHPYQCTFKGGILDPPIITIGKTLSKDNV